MKKIYKYTLQIEDKQTLKLPEGSKILSVAEQNNSIVLYALVNTATENAEHVSVIIHGTGHQANDVDGCTFLGTVKLYGGDLMFHVFVKTNN
ncbi:MAG: hypothetical protein PHW65_06910 [Dehalococcoidales bacterium]|nr:hypothetical protein [Dehalococcoidales bacterium]